MEVRYINLGGKLVFVSFLAVSFPNKHSSQGYEGNPCLMNPQMLLLKICCQQADPMSLQTMGWLVAQSLVQSLSFLVKNKLTCIKKDLSLRPLTSAASKSRQH